MNEILISKLYRAFELTYDLIKHLDEDCLSLYLGNLPSNRIGDQIWCVVGARESYLKALQAEKWSGFNCSLHEVTTKNEVLKSLSNSLAGYKEFLNRKTLSNIQINLLFDLLEHEITHHGQLMRYVYGNKLSFPQSWKDRYNV